MNLVRPIRYYWLRILRQKGRAENIAGGVALGVFLGFALPPGVQIIVGVALAPLLRCNPIAAALGTFVSNPVTIPLIYPAALQLGKYITDLPVRQASELIPTEDRRLWAFITDFRTHGRAIVLMWVGLVTMGSASAFVAFYLTKAAVLRFRHRRRHSRARALLARLRHSEPAASKERHPEKPREE